MDIVDLLSNGYLPKELPPPFSGKIFAQHSSTILQKWNALSATKKVGLHESICTKYSIPRVNYSRRIISIPNPLHQQTLAEVIVSNWQKIDSFCQQSVLSASRPIIDASGKRAITTLKKFSEYKRAYVKGSFDRLFEIRTDIARFFPSIYTHSLAWAIHGKDYAKRNRRNADLLGNALDIAVRACQSNQTIGIPIGPDTSIVLSEILATAIDLVILGKHRVNGYRFVDDYHLFCKTHGEAEHVLKFMQACFAEYGLDINDSKTDIVKFPQPFESKWTIELGAFRFSSEVHRQHIEIGQYFSLIFQNSKDYPDDSVIKYGIKLLNKYWFSLQNWPYLESLLLKTTIAFPQTLPEVFFHLRRYWPHVHQKALKRTIIEILTNHNDKGHSFELSWILWIAKFFGIKVPSKFGGQLKRLVSTI